MNEIFSIRTNAADNQLIKKASFQNFGYLIFFKIKDLDDKPNLTIYIVITMWAYANIDFHD